MQGRGTGKSFLKHTASASNPHNPHNAVPHPAHPTRYKKRFERVQLTKNAKQKHLDKPQTLEDNRACTCARVRNKDKSSKPPKALQETRRQLDLHPALRHETLEYQVSY